METLRDDEQEYYDNMSEGLQAGEKGSRAEASAQALGEAVDDLDNVLSNLAMSLE